MIPDFPYIKEPLDKQRQFAKILEELSEYMNELDAETAALEWADFHQAVYTYERAHFTLEQVKWARESVIQKNTERGYYAP